MKRRANPRFRPATVSPRSAGARKVRRGGTTRVGFYQRRIKILRPFEFPRRFLRDAISGCPGGASGGISPGIRGRAKQREITGHNAEKQSNINFASAGGVSVGDERRNGTIAFQFTGDGFNYGNDLETSRTRARNGGWGSGGKRNCSNYQRGPPAGLGFSN